MTGGRQEIENTDRNLNRPGLQLARGISIISAADRIQVIGKVEMTYITETMDSGNGFMYSSGSSAMRFLRRHQPKPGAARGASRGGSAGTAAGTALTACDHQLVHDTVSYLDLLLALRSHPPGRAHRRGRSGDAPCGRVGHRPRAKQRWSSSSAVTGSWPDDVVEICRNIQGSAEGPLSGLNTRISWRYGVWGSLTSSRCTASTLL